MQIHVVEAGENIYEIAMIYDTSPERIILDNELTHPNRLVPGQTLVILRPEQVYTVMPGDTIYGIAQRFGITPAQLAQNNPNITLQGQLYPGQTVVIKFEGEKIGDISINGYAYPNIDREVLRRTLPFLTYLTIFTYGIRPDGTLIAPDDVPLIALAREYGVAPLMLISTLGEDGQFSNQLANTVVNDPAVQSKLIDEVLATLEAKNYYGLDVDFEYVFASDRDAYVRFIEALRSRLEPEGYPVFVALAPKTSSTQPGLLYEGHDYAAMGAAANYVLLMTYEWGYTYGPPMAVAPVNKVREVLNYAVTEIPPAKIFMGIPNYAYNWTLPFVQGTSRAVSLSNVQAVELASQVGANIQFDPVAMAPFYNYYDEQGSQHVVWFEDARSIQAKGALPQEYGFQGSSIWNIMRYFPQLWLVINSMYNIRKVLYS